MNAAYSNGVEMLPTPNPATLTDAQVDGTACVWCGGVPEMPLGPRISVVGRSLSRWWPRACPGCTAREAARVNEIHLKSCQRCTRRAYCADSRALHALSLNTPAARPAPAGRRESGRVSLGGEERSQ